MFFGNRRFDMTGAQRVAWAQAVLALVGGLSGAVFSGAGAGLAVMFGVLVALAVSLVLVWRERQSMRHPEWDQHRLFKLFVRAWLERLVVLVGLLGLGLAVLKLAPLPMMLGLVLAQFAWLAAAASRNTQ
jgi:ATP synthase protein I